MGKFSFQKISVASVFILAALTAPFQSREQTPKFYNWKPIVLPKACGDGIDKDTACGSCVRTGPIAVTKFASCGHACLKLPDNLTPDKVTVSPEAAEGDNPNVPAASYKTCGKSYEACLGYDRFEGVEWYADTHMICGRFKNWNTRTRVYAIKVYEK